MNREIHVTLPVDDEGMLGRHCPSSECGRYFKLRPGTGLATDICHCPYCGASGSPQDFATEDQIEYAKSVAVREVIEPPLRQLERSLKRLERQTAGGLIRFEAKLRRQRFTLHRFVEQQLETKVTCDSCNLEFAVFGVFASCPDCQRLNALTTCLASLEVARKRVRLLEDSEIDTDLRRQFPRDALRDSVAAFDSYGKALRAKYPGLIRPRAKTNLFQDLETLDAELENAGLPRTAAMLSTADAAGIRWFFQARHVYEHNAGVVDDRFIDRVPEAASLRGKLLPLPEIALVAGIEAIDKLARAMDRTFTEAMP